MRKCTPSTLSWLMLILVTCTVSRAEDILLPDGRHFPNATVTVGTKGAEIQYRPAGGGMAVVAVPFSLLPTNLQARYQTRYDDLQKRAAVESARQASQPNPFQEALDKAEKGDIKSQSWLGWWYFKGSVQQKDVHEAARWYLRAAKQGDAMAQVWLAWGFFYGRGVPQDYAEAYKWIDLAAAQNADALSAWKLSISEAQEARNEIAKQLSPEMIAEGQRRATLFVVKQEAVQPAHETAATGTGFFVTDDGYLVTCAHVVSGATSFHVKTTGGSIPAKLVVKDTGLDVALLKVSGRYSALPLDIDSHVKLGDSVFTIGFPNPDLQGTEPKLTKGEISSLTGLHDSPRRFQISVPVQPGNSGGALVDERGNVVGVVVARLDDAVTYETSGALPQNVNYAIKGGLVYGFLNSVPELSGKLKAPNTAKDPDAANSAAERAAVLVVAE